jgi:hypothetical protein
MSCEDPVRLLEKVAHSTSMQVKKGRSATLRLRAARLGERVAITFGLSVVKEHVDSRVVNERSQSSALRTG